MALTHSPSIVTSNLVLYIDMYNNEKCFDGEPTTNLVAYSGFGNYNNVPSDVTTVLEDTGNYYRGAKIYKQTITPITSAGVSYLTNGNNPGIGVVGSGGGGTAGRYTGHSIFFKPTGPMHSTPIFNGYSNISGWGAGATGSNAYDVYEDGWYRAKITWYDSVTRSDGKYWAINPAGALLGVPIVIYWAGPFKEDNNNSNYISRFAAVSRSSTQVVKDLANQNTLTVNSLTYSTTVASSKNPRFTFNGSNSITAPNISAYNFDYEQTIEAWITPTTLTGRRNIWNQAYAGAGTWTHEPSGAINYYCGTGGYDNSPYIGFTSGFTVAANETAMVTLTRTHDTISWYKNGVLSNTTPNPYGNIYSGPNAITIGSGYAGGFVGSIHSVKAYTKALTAAQVWQNFNVHRQGYGL